MSKKNYNFYKSALLTGENGSFYINKLTKQEIVKAKQEVEVELRNKNFKNKSF